MRLFISTNNRVHDKHFLFLPNSEFTKPKSLPKDLSDEEYIKYLILFRNWRKAHCSDDIQTRFIIERASKFMRPQSTLKSNNKYSFLPPTTLDKATALYVETTQFTTNQLKVVIYCFCKMFESFFNRKMTENCDFWVGKRLLGVFSDEVVHTRFWLKEGGGCRVG